MLLRNKNINEDEFKEEDKKKTTDYLTPKANKRKAECPPAPRPSKKSSRSSLGLSMVFESIDFTENDEKKSLLEDNLKELKLFSDEITSYKDRNHFIDAIHDYLSTSYRPLFK